MCGCLREREDPSRPMADAARALYRLTDRFPALLRSNSRCTNLHHPLYHPAPPPLSPPGRSTPTALRAGVCPLLPPEETG
jgi:hypothetical protein